MPANGVKTCRKCGRPITNVSSIARDHGADCYIEYLEEQVLRLKFLADVQARTIEKLNKKLGRGK